MTHPEQLGPFRIDRLIGRGGMGAVYKAEYEDNSSPLAIKVLLDPMEGDSELRNRFEAEIETLRRLRHPNIVRLFGFGQDEGHLYYAMEFVDGPSLQELLRRKHHFTWEETVHIGSQVAQALRHAHDRGIIHRDIKPANILLPATGNVKVSDYGIAHLFGGVRLTDVNMVIGTIEYMSPEQASAGPITPKSDIYSLGALLYVLLTGLPPYGIQTKSLPELLRKYRQGPPESVRYKRPDIPSELDALLLELLQVAVNKRPATAQIVQRRLETILGSYAKTGVLARYFEKNGPEESGSGPTGEEKTVSDNFSRDRAFRPSADSSPLAVSSEGRNRDDGEISAASDGTDHSLRPTLPLEAVPSSATDETERGTEEIPTASASNAPIPLNAAVTPTNAVTPTSVSASDAGGKNRAETRDFTLDESGGRSSFYGDLSDIGETNRLESDRMITTRILTGKEDAADFRTIRADSTAESIRPAKTASVTSSSTGTKGTSTAADSSGVDSDDSLDEKGSGGKKASHFVRVSEEEFDPFLKEDEKSPYVSVQVLVFSMILLLVGVLFWYALRRPSVDSLYHKIEEKIGETSSESGYLSALRLLDDDFKKFLSYYPNDPRAEKIREYSEELELANLERRLEQQIERRRSRSSLSIVENAYIEAIRDLENNPETGRKKLVAFIEIFSFGSSRTDSVPSASTEEEKRPERGKDSKPDEWTGPKVTPDSEKNQEANQTLPGQCVILAKRRLEQVEKDYEQKKRLETELLESHFGLADSLEATDPKRANQIRRGLINFYGDRLWAVPLIHKAQERIKAAESPVSVSGAEASETIDGQKVEKGETAPDPPKEEVSAGKEE